MFPTLNGLIVQISGTPETPQENPGVCDSRWKGVYQCHTITNVHKVVLTKCEYKRSIRQLFNPKVGVKAIARTFASGKTEKLVYQVISLGGSKTLYQIKILDINNLL